MPVKGPDIFDQKMALSAVVTSNSFVPIIFPALISFAVGHVIIALLPIEYTIVSAAYVRLFVAELSIVNFLSCIY